MLINPDLERTRQEFAEACKGIRRPRVKTLRAGDILYRFASSINVKKLTPIDKSEWSMRPWWVQREDYRHIVQAYRSGKLAFGTVARMALAVVPSMSNMDRSIKARLKNDINVWVGEASTQYRDMMPNGIFVTAYGWRGIEQVYIPGVPDSIVRGLQIIRQAPIETDNLGLPVR